MERISIRVTRQQGRKLRALAKRQGRSRAELIRLGIDRLLADPPVTTDPLLDLVGAAGPVKATDLSDNHDDLL